jgi:glycosyltransferase involved in cell wall biosynthesis
MKLHGHQIDNKSNDILLSILIPAFNYYEGVKKIFKHLDLLSIPYLWKNIEVVVMDDSTNNDIEIQINSIIDTIECVRYVRNKPSVGACKNWNKMIGQAHGKYYILMHHDEFPLTEGFVAKAVQIINNNNNVDMVMMDCLLMNRSANTLRRHMPSFYRKFFFDIYPEYLFNRNFIGPTSTLIIKRSLHSNFNCKLNWLIDVEQYYNLSKKVNYWIFSKELKIVSFVDRDSSITNKLKNHVVKIHKMEYKYVLEKYAGILLWSNKKFYRIMEIMVWTAFRKVYLFYWRIMNRVKIYPVSRKNFRRAFEYK